MKEWLREFKRTREAGRLLRLSLTLRAASKPYRYDFENHLPMGAMHAGHVRAALMRAVSESTTCRTVEMPVLLSTREEISRFFTDALVEFRDGGFDPLAFDIALRGDRYVLTVSVFSHEDVAYTRPMFQDAS